DAQISGRRRHAVGQLALGAVVIDRAAARWAAHETDAEPAARGDVDVAIERLPIADGDRRRGPREEAPGRRRCARLAAAPQRFVDRHVGGAVGRLGDQEAPIHVGGPEMAPASFSEGATPPRTPRPTLGTPRGTRGAPRPRASAWGST